MAGWSMVSWRDRKWVKGIFTFMWIMNLLILPVGLLNYSQKARIEPLLRLGRMDDVGGIIAVTIEHPQRMPYFYAQYKTDFFYEVKQDSLLDQLPKVIQTTQDTLDIPDPTHVVLISHKDPAIYLTRLEKQLGPLQQVMHISPSLADWILHKMNPRFNHSKESYVYRLVEPWRIIGSEIGVFKDKLPG